MPLNSGHVHRERVPAWARGLSVLAYLVRAHGHSDEATWRSRLAAGEVRLDGKTAHGGEELRPGGHLDWHRPPWEEEAVPLDFAVVHEDAALLAVAKPSGLPTLPGGGFLEGTLLTGVRRRWPGARPLHRLGRGTSGLVLFALTPEAAAALARAWRAGEVGKGYRALGAGHPDWEERALTTPVGPVPHPRLGTVYAASAFGKPSLSVARVLERRSGATLFEVDLHTGRPHQIRIHLAAAGHPLLGDPLYAPGGLPRPDDPALPGDLGYLLHAERLTLAHPLTGERLTLRAGPPAALRRAGEEDCDPGS
ncbi:pseudouridine synthase [Deinococcus sp. RL]|uniref:RluA family pseudouridine synthase n=1 Tax=Deinococcus sp. RL TaxID=1489678 RepID=UPI0004DA469E|nr:RluA family pseudouridine synthase [Deinococcus sp. RL]KEF34491.1 pseudouridine synthase [Deinococcus sp. RL]